MFKIGISSKVLRDYNLIDAIDLAVHIGYEAFELWIDDIIACGCPVEKLKEYLDSKGLMYSIHLPTEDLNISSFNEGIRKESLKQQSEAMALAATLGVQKVTLHPGRKTAKSKTLEESWKVQIESIRHLVKTAELHDIMLCVENMEIMAGEYVHTQSDMEKIRDAIKSQHLGFTLDIAHLQTIEQAEKAIKDISYPIHNVHISQATKDKMHLPIAKMVDGGINYETALAHLKNYYDGTLIIEGYVRGKGEQVARESYEWFKQMKQFLREEK